MVRPDEYLLGYYEGRVDKSDTCKLINTLLKLGICSDVSDNGAFRIRAKDKTGFTKYARSRIRYELGDAQGVYGFVCRMKNRYGLILALITMTVIYTLSSNLVWDVRIDGNEHLPEYVIRDSLSNCGFGVGSSWTKTDKNAVEAMVLENNKDLAWISINRRGTVAYVNVIESENVFFGEASGPLYSNIIADRDGVISEISVSSGVAVVKVGDVVRAGDVLISGIIETERGVTMCRAEGTVRAECVRDVSAEAYSTVQEKRILSQRLAQVRAVLFNFSINIFKNYGNHSNMCDIIEEKRDFVLFDKYNLPIRIEKVYVCEYSQEDRKCTEDEMIAAAKRQLDGKIYTMFNDADVIKLRTRGEMKDGVFCLTSRVVYSAEIGKESAIEIN